MREYYYLTGLEQSPYDLTMVDALHLGATGELQTYIFLTDHVEAEHPIEGKPDSYEGRTVSSQFVRAPNATMAGLEKVTVNFVVMKYGYLDHRSDEPDPVSNSTLDSGNLLQKLLCVAFSSPWPMVERDDLLCFTDDLEKLAGKGLIKRRDKGINTSANEHVDDETDAAVLRRAQRALAALAIGLAKKDQAYRHGKRPNVSALTKVAITHLQDKSGRAPHRFSDKNISKAISEALEACPELTEHSDKAD